MCHAKIGEQISSRRRDCWIERSRSVQRMDRSLGCQFGERLPSAHLMMLRQGFSRWRTALSAMMMLSNSSSTSLVPRTRCSTDLAASARPSSTRELGVLGRKMPPSSRMEPGTAARAREMRQPLHRQPHQWSAVYLQRLSIALPP